MTPSCAVTTITIVLLPIVSGTVICALFAAGLPLTVIVDVASANDGVKTILPEALFTELVYVAVADANTGDKLPSLILKLFSVAIAEAVLVTVTVYVFFVTPS